MSKSIEQKLKGHLSAHDFDIRKSGNARFIDQKCTPDVVCAVAEVILEFVDEDKAKKFTVKSIWKSLRANEIMVDLFQKPAVTEPKAQSEYDKVFSQPIKLLEYAGILKSAGKVGNANAYKIRKRKLLNYISVKDKNALVFLVAYLEKVLIDSELMPIFNIFFSKPTKANFRALKMEYVDFIIENTAINGKTETRRIFTKIINPLAFSRKTYGAKKGTISPHPISYSELFYNRVNFRDVKKPKGVTRKQFWENFVETSSSDQYLIEKAKRQIKKRHGTQSEVHRYGLVAAVHVHHIFMKSEFPELSDVFENLILLTPSQHGTFAHPDGNTQVISKSYQLVCLLSKLESIEQSVAEEDGFYELDEFKDAVNIGLDEQLLTKQMTFEDIKHILSEKYLS